MEDRLIETYLHCFVGVFEDGIVKNMVTGPILILILTDQGFRFLSWMIMKLILFFNKVPHEAQFEFADD